jgi:SAM-dependent methyltransferase
MEAPPSHSEAMQPAEYAALAAVEDRLWYFRSLHRLVAGELGRTLGSGPAALLDAGCGTGGLMRRLGAARPGWTWTGVEASPVACAYARDQGAGNVIEAALPRLPFPDGTFDAVVLADVLYQVEDDVAALRECWRILRPGGVVVATVPAYRWLWSYHDVAVEGRRRYSRMEILGKLRQSGFGAARATYWNTLFLPVLILRRKVLAAPRAGSDVRPYPAALEALGRALAAVEYGLLRALGGLPFGGSILVSARKPA